jgi:hypothetical protein
LPREGLQKRDHHHTSTKFQLRVIRHVHELFKWSSYFGLQSTLRLYCTLILNYWCINMLLKIFNPRLHIRITFIDKKLSLLSVARAFAIIVFEHPGGPNIRTPCGGEIPSRVKTSGCFKGHSTA